MHHRNPNPKQVFAHNPSPGGRVSMSGRAMPHFFYSTCPSPSERRCQSPNGSPPPERVRDRRGRRGVEGEECGGVSAGGMAVAPPGRRRAFRVRSPTTPPDAPERGAEAADTRRTRTGLRALCREYPSNCCPQTDADSRLRGAGQIRICQPRVRHGVARFGDNVGAYPAVRPAGPCRQMCVGHPRVQTKCRISKRNARFRRVVDIPCL